MTESNRSRTREELDRLIAAHRDESKTIADKAAADRDAKQKQPDADLDDGITV